MKIGFQLVVFALAILVAFGVVLRASGSMTSGNYVIQSDTINFSGAPSVSSNYSLNDTAGEIATGDSVSANYAMHAGFWQMQESSISISVPSDVNLTPDINGLLGGSASGSATWTILTDDPAGYTLIIRSGSDPSLLGNNGSSFNDYSPSGGSPDYTWAAASNTAVFGFTPEGTDIVQRYRDNGSVCNTGSLDTPNKCWEGLGTVNKTIAQGSGGNQPSGTPTTVRFQAESGNAKITPNDTYTATIVVTALPL